MEGTAPPGHDWAVASTPRSDGQAGGSHGKKAVYLDYNGSAPLDPRVTAAMLPVMESGVGNASAAHRFGRMQAALVDDAREEVASLVGGHAGSVVFTSGATEANNLALQGTFASAPARRNRLLVSAVEHASVREVAQWLSDQGLAKVQVLPVTPGGHVDLDALEEAMSDDVLLVSVMAANSETGVLNPIPAISECIHGHGALLHSDATQMVGRLGFDMTAVGADLVSISGHKMCGPTGVGALVGSRHGLAKVRPVIHGGGHELGLRSGSLNVAGIVGLGTAARIAVAERQEEAVRTAALRDRLVDGITEQAAGVAQNGDTSQRLPNTASLRFAGADAEAVMAYMDPVAVSAGSACSSGAIEPSGVLLAMGLSREEAYESIRFSVGRFTTTADVDTAIESTVAAVRYVRAVSQGHHHDSCETPHLADSGFHAAG